MLVYQRVISRPPKVSIMSDCFGNQEGCFQEFNVKRWPLKKKIDFSQGLITLRTNIFIPKLLLNMICVFLKSGIYVFL